LIGALDRLVDKKVVSRLGPMTGPMTAPISPEIFREFFALASFSDGGIVLNVSTGSYSRLNASAALLCAEIEKAESLQTALASISERLGISLELATRHVQALTAALHADGIRHEPPEPFRYRPSHEGGYDLWHEERLVLHIGGRAERLWLMSNPAELPLPLYDYVSGVAPKLLGIQGKTVLHGSSCLVGTALLGICGRSGAGKTTTARTLAKYTGGLVSEDLLVLGPDLRNPFVFIGGESYVHRWSLEAVRALGDHVGADCDADTLGLAASGESIPLRSIWFLDVRRRGELFSVRPLERADALGHLMTNNFLGSAGTTNWRRHLIASTAITSAVESFELSVPNGIERLDDAIRRYATNSAS
jgi:hypothetical protein